MNNIDIGEHKAIISQDEYKLFLKFKYDYDDALREAIDVAKSAAHREVESNYSWNNREILDQRREELNKHRGEINKITPIPTLCKLIKKWLKIEKYGEDLK